MPPESDGAPLEYFRLWHFSIRAGYTRWVPSKSPSLGKAIAFRRNGLELSQEELAERAGVHRTYISQLERDLKSPTVDTLRKIAAALDVRASKLIQLTEGADEL